MDYPQHLKAFIALGRLFNRAAASPIDPQSPWLAGLLEALKRAEVQNGWYTQDNLRFALKQWGEMLTETALLSWINAYHKDMPTKVSSVGIIMAGNIPLVGFHDFLCVLLSGHKVIAKLSTNDQVLFYYIRDFLIHEDPILADKITLTTERLTNFDAVIATGSNNTSRYFEYYFSKYPHIIRQHRNSVAVLSGQESQAQLKALGDDIFQYFGLGCRSVSKLFVPNDYDFDTFFSAIFPWQSVLQHHKYCNNYDYNKAVYLMSEVTLLENGFLLLKEDGSQASPIATLFFERYTSTATLQARLSEDKNSIQCIVAEGFSEIEVPFGTAQTPTLSDYADNVDTMAFLAELRE
ncbi:MAG: acyl-CoA reductase [Bacteroidota bacterium]